MRRISMYFLDGKSLAFTMDEVEYENLIVWINTSEDMLPFKFISNKLEYYIFKRSIEYIIV
jgi:hypothetical protein